MTFLQHLRAIDSSILHGCSEAITSSARAVLFQRLIRLNLNEIKYIRYNSMIQFQIVLKRRIFISLITLGLNYRAAVSEFKS